MSDYLKIEYSEEKRPSTDYPSKLARYLFSNLNFKKGQSLLEFGSGRAEILSSFSNLGLETFAVDSAESSNHFAQAAGAKFEQLIFTSDEPFSIFNEKKFDIVFSKSFVEHIPNPIDFAQASYKLLKPGGLFVTLTPDWESNQGIFYDDLTHVKPFTKVTLNQMLEYGNFEIIEIKTFRQLPITWHSKFFNFLAHLTSFFAPPRSRNKWLRWSRELMIIGVGRKPLI